MKRIEELIAFLKSNWSTPKYSRQNSTGFKLKCIFNEGKLLHKQQLPVNVPEQIVAFWEQCYGAKLFLDSEYGQWGLEMYTYEEAVHKTEEEKKDWPDEYEDHDFIIGRFIGDQELLVVSCKEEDYGKIVVALPIDKRADWDFVANSFLEFLEAYTREEGNKYWQQFDRNRWGVRLN